ncbi:hypothetical protein QQF64_027756 [Cirrhinus molitorella]|uniref:Uncharacterized protein n=1 Tax=Cirrhinus molitorella TaxID=172907 RepID=A0ABR3NDL9_9TELE
MHSRALEESPNKRWSLFSSWSSLYGCVHPGSSDRRAHAACDVCASMQFCCVSLQAYQNCLLYSSSPHTRMPPSACASMRLVNPLMPVHVHGVR